MKKRIAIIPARSGSKRVRNKNILNFFNKPMIGHTIENILKSNLFDCVHISTDSDEVIKVCSKYSIKTKFKRLPELADDETPILDVVKWVLQKYLTDYNQHFDTAALITPCSPLINKNDYIQAIKTFEINGSHTPVLSVTSYPAPIEWALEEENNHLLKASNSELMKIRSQDLTEKYYDTGNFCILNPSKVLNSKDNVLSEFIKYFIPRHRAVDLDTPEDLKMLEILFAAQHKPT